MSNKKPKLKIVTYGGRLGWFLRKYFSFITSDLYLNWQYLIRRSLFKKYIEFFDYNFLNGNTLQPCLISIETINRCNSTCSFCPANKDMESRPFQKMDEELFYKIISELKEIDYAGYLNLYVNNEPFIDNRIEDWYIYAKSQLPMAKMLLYTNGTLLNRERFSKIIPVIDKCIINNYTETLKLHTNLKDIVKMIKEEKVYWDKDITIQIRYIKEILTNRAGDAPNKRKKSNNKMICIMPFTDFTIYPDGTVGLCCSDALEKTNYGNVANESIRSIWSSKQYQKLRHIIGNNRSDYSFCNGCDFVDAGIRNEFMNSVILSAK